MADRHLIVTALGGNAISRPDEEGTVEQQFANSRITAHQLHDLIDMGYDIVITHGNGPQIGNALIRNRTAATVNNTKPLPMPSVAASVSGGMGYMIAQTMMNEIYARGSTRIVTSIVTTVIVDRTDPTFEVPTKPIGGLMTVEQAKQAMGAEDWTVKQVRPGMFRRLVPSPRPVEIIETDAIKTLVGAGHLVVACGGGGVPVVRNAQHELEGIHAVVDKDLASALLAVSLDASMLMILSNVDHVSIDFGTPTQQDIEHMTLNQAIQWLEEGQFPAGSMGPKVQGAIYFLQHATSPDAEVRIGPLHHAADVCRGVIGTRITKE